MDDVIFKEIEADLNLAKLETVLNLEKKLRQLKERYHVRIIETERGFKLRGSLKHIVEFGKNCNPRNESEDIKQFYILSNKTENLQDVQRFFDGDTWGDVENSIVSNANVPFTPANVCCFLLYNKDQIIEKLHEANARLKFKDFTNDKIRLKIEKTEFTTKLPVKIEDEIKDFCAASTTGMSEMKFTVNDLIVPKAFASEVMQFIEKGRGVVLLARDQDTKNAWRLSVLMLNSVKDKVSSSIAALTKVYSHENNSAKNILRRLSDYQHQLVDGTQRRFGSSNIEADVQSDAKAADTESEKVEHTTVKVEKHTEILVGDEEVIDYIVKFKQDDVQGIKAKYGVEIELTKKVEGVVILKSKPSNLEKANLKFTHFAKDMIQSLRTETIDISSLDSTNFKMRQKEAFEAAAKLKFLIRKESESRLFIVGPRKCHAECINAIKTALGILSHKRRMLTSSTMAPESMIVKPKEYVARATLPPTRLVGPHPLQKAYKTDNDIWVLAWITDITKLHVDIVVNAANEQLAHGAGVAYAILKAGGTELERECKKYIRTYDDLAVTKLCLTTAGKMPSKQVMHAVGPRWSDYRDKQDFKEYLFKTFYNCLDRAEKNGHNSIAIPAISSGIFGGPKDVVTDMAIRALLVFCREFPFSKLTWIHFVDVLPDIVVCYHQKLNACVSQGMLKEDKTYGDYDHWMGSQGPTQTLWITNEKKKFDYGGQNLPRDTNGVGDSTFSQEYCTDDEEKEKDMEWRINVDDTGLPLRHFTDSKNNENGNGTDVDIPDAVDQSVKSSYAETVKMTAKLDIPKVHPPSLKSTKSAPNGNTKTERSDKEKEKEEENCSICIDKPRNPKTLHKCKHTFCAECIEKCFSKINPKCPNCGVVYGELKGDQPANGTMRIQHWRSSLPGYYSSGTLEIKYYFPDGKQGKNHPNPGKAYSGTTRRAYLPDNKEGNKVIQLLKKAFDAQMVFTIGRSSTTGQDDCVIWNCIHHKTRQTGGPQSYGYPDPTYLCRVQEELKAQGFQ